MVAVFLETGRGGRGGEDDGRTLRLRRRHSEGGSSLGVLGRSFEDGLRVPAHDFVSLQAFLVLSKLAQHLQNAFVLATGERRADPVHHALGAVVAVHERATLQRFEVRLLLHTRRCCLVQHLVSQHSVQAASTVGPCPVRGMIPSCRDRRLR